MERTLVGEAEVHTYQIDLRQPLVLPFFCSVPTAALLLTFISYLSRESGLPL